MTAMVTISTFFKHRQLRCTFWLPSHALPAMGATGSLIKPAVGAAGFFGATAIFTK